MWPWSDRPAAPGEPASLRRGDPVHAAEADVARGGVDGLALARGRAVAQAVARRAQVRAALDHAPRDLPAAAPPRRSSRRPRRRRRTRRRSTPTRCRSCRAARSRWAGTRRPATCRGSRATGTRPARCSPSAGRRARVVAPGVGRALEPAARRALPLGLGRQRLARPRRVRLGVLVAHVHHRVARRACRCRCPGPRRCQHAPGTYAHQLRASRRGHRPARRVEHERAGDEHRRVGVRVVGRRRAARSATVT